MDDAIYCSASMCGFELHGPQMRPLLRVILTSLTVILVAILIVAMLTVWPLPAPDVNPERVDVLIHNVSVIDVRQGRALSGKDVWLHGDTIRAIADHRGPVDEHSHADNLKHIDGEGRFLMPALWDLHTHSTKLSRYYYHPALIAHGVTAVREMWGCLKHYDPYLACPADRSRWDTEAARGQRLSPRFFGQGSYAVNGGNEVPGDAPEFFRVETPEHMHELLDFYEARGIDFIKIYSELPAPRYKQLATLARDRGIQLAGHRPLSVSLDEAMAMGQRSIEHPRLFLFECHRDAESFRALDDPRAAYTLAYRQSLLDDEDPAFCAQLMERMAQSETAWVPTMQVLRMSAMARHESFRNADFLAHTPWIIRKGIWLPDAQRAAEAPVDADGTTIHERLYARAKIDVLRAHKRGVQILVGTDAGDSFVTPGLSVHQELAELVDAGMPVDVVLRAATLDAANFMGVSDHRGAVEVGYAADLLLLEANPLRDVSATRDISVLFFAGRVYDRSTLDALWSYTRDYAGSLRLNLKVLRGALSSPLIRAQIAD